jgi:hypothetical protein
VEMSKSELNARLCPGGHRPVTASIFAEQFAGLLVDEMQTGAGEANHRRIGIGLVARRYFRKPVLHVGAQMWAFENKMTAHPRNQTC